VHLFGRFGILLLCSDTAVSAQSAGLRTCVAGYGVAVRVGFGTTLGAGHFVLQTMFVTQQPLPILAATASYCGSMDIPVYFP
jgi:hypothetical protein